MIKFTLPVLEQELVGNKIVKSVKDMTCYLDISAASQEVWEREFPIQAKNEGLFDYIARIKAKSASVDKSNISLIISALKAIYCVIRFEKPMSKDEFLSLFNFTDADYYGKLVGSLKNVFEAVNPDEQKNF